MRISAEEDQLAGEIGWFLDHLAGERRASIHTVSAYDRDLRQIAQWLRDYGVDSFLQTTGDASAMVRSKLAGYAPTTIQRKLSALRSAIGFISRRRGEGPSKLPSTGGFRKPKTLPKALSLTEMEALCSSPNLSEPVGLRDHAMIELLFGAGLRVSELVGLRLEDYSESESVLRIFGKREKVRLVPLPVQTHNCLRDYLKGARGKLTGLDSGSYVFLNHRGNRLSRSGVFRILRGHAKNAGIEKDIGPHTLRHTYAVHLVKNGADLRSVQELLGHASIATTEVYTHLDMETVREKYAASHPRSKRRVE
jgi:integrase/recombinase XerD